uniref:DHH family protein n=1 Tax=viral metagenome TaxID=1070528 RepID=A0A6C0KRR9_9ZZZZ
MSNYSILFHGNCIDGWFSAFIAHKKLSQSGTVRLYPVAPTGSGIPSIKLIKDTHVLMVDVSFDIGQRQKWMKGGALSVECIDHHATSKDQWPADGNPIHTECCAALQVFRHFFPEEVVPFWIYVIDRIDRWDNPTYEDRCIREVLNELAHKPVQDKSQIEAVIEETNQWMTKMASQEGQIENLTTGKQILDQKDAELCKILTRGDFITLDFNHATEWQLPNTWLGLNLYLINNTDIMIDTTEASHVVFTNYPGVDVFINYREKSFLTKEGGMVVQKKSIVYYARSREFNLTEGTIFRGHPTAAGATLIKGEAPLLPFLITA